MKTGHLQRHWSEEKPKTFDKENLIVSFDILNEQRKNEEGITVDGFSYVQVQIDSLIDYAHIKSQLIESGYAQKDEFGLLMNGVNDILNALIQAKDLPTLQNGLKTEDLKAFQDFCEFRQLCADTAKTVVDSYYKI